MCHVAYQSSYIREFKQTRGRRQRERHLTMSLRVSAIISQLFKVITLAKCALTIVELSWNQRFIDKTKLNICHRMLIHTACTKTRNTETKPPKPPKPPEPPKHRNETTETTETPKRNHQNTYKNLNKTIETASMALPLLNSGRIIMNNNFSNTHLWFSCFSSSFITIFAVSQSTNEEWKQKILLLFSFTTQIKLCHAM